MLSMIKAITRPARRRLAVALGKDLSFTPELSVATEFHGSEYGGFAILKDSLSASSVVLSCGIGEDATFDLSVIAKYGCTIHAFDPTPKSVAWVRDSIQERRFEFHECAIADTDGTLRLYLPSRVEWVSASVEPGAHTRDEHVDVQARRLATIRQTWLNGRDVDVLKMDIEGAEYAVLRDLLTAPDSFLPEQIAVEFHHFYPAFGLAATRDAVQLLRARGYQLAWVSPTHHELLFVRTGTKRP